MAAFGGVACDVLIQVHGGSPIRVGTGDLEVEARATATESGAGVELTMQPTAIARLLCDAADTIDAHHQHRD